MTTYRLELRDGQPDREVKADTFMEETGWLIFSRYPATGGTSREFFRIRLAEVLTMETGQ